ncbi:TnsA-like heteromeric transposase endonuclease subunit [Nocardia brasiliensis]
MAFEVTRQACELIGWENRLLGMPDPVFTANLRWLAGYRHPRYFRAEVAQRLCAAFAEPVALVDGAEAVGDPIAVLPVLFHLIWCHQLSADLSLPLRAVTPVRAGC